VKVATALIMQARVAAGWIEAADLIEPEEELDPEAEAETVPAADAEPDIASVFGN